MNLSENLSQEIANLITPLSAEGILMPKTAEEIFKNSDHWFPKFDDQQNLVGFFEYRTHDGTQLAEMGSVLVLKPGQGIGACLLQIFNTQKDIQAASGGFAVTKDFSTAHGFFADKADGDVYESHQFPLWFNRVCTDRYFVQWK